MLGAESRFAPQHPLTSSWGGQRPSCAASARGEDWAGGCLCGATLEEFNQIVPAADEQPLPLRLRQTPEQELLESTPLLDPAGHRFHGDHAQAIRLPSPGA